MTWDLASSRLFISIGRATILGLFGAVVASCSPADLGDERTSGDQKPIVWHDQIESDEDILDPSVANDQRREVFEEQDEFAHGDPRLPGYHWLRSFAQESTVTLISEVELTERQPFDSRLLKFPDATNHKLRKKLCDGQRYTDQLAPGFCSGTLIDDDLVLTAAHCVFDLSAPDPAEVRVVFNHYNIATDAPADIECDTPAGRVCESEDVFRMRLILVGNRFADTAEDWAIVQLVDENGDPKPARRYRPAPVRLDGSTSPLGTTLAKIGAPSGLPLKISLTKRVQDHVGLAAFTDKIYQAFLDSFGGDSGGGVYDAERLDLVAVVSGSANFVIDGKPTPFVPNLPDGECFVAGVCPMSANRVTQLQAAGVTVNCQDASGQLRPDTFVRVDVPLAHLCERPVDVPPAVKDFPPGFSSERLCAQTTNNDTCDTAERFELKLNHEITLSGDTSFLSNGVEPSCAETSGAPNAFYEFEVPAGKRIMFYADTFGPGNSFDTVLFLQQGCPSGTERICNDDSFDCPNEGDFPFLRSRFALPLDPGTYFLGITGFAGAAGPYSIHVQALELSDNGILLSQNDLGSVLFIDDNTNNSTGSGAESFCGMPGSKDFQVLYFTCPDYVGGPLFATTCDALTSFDTVLSFAQGSRPFSGCQDDMLTLGCFRQSSLGFTSLVRANSGSGMRALYVDGFSPADSGNFGLNVFLPP